MLLRNKHILIELNFHKNETTDGLLLLELKISLTVKIRKLDTYTSARLTMSHNNSFCLT